MPGALYRLGARVSTRGRLSWVPPDVSEPLPLNVDVLLSAEHVLVFDTGPQALYPQLTEQVRAHLQEIVLDAPAGGEVRWAQPYLARRPISRAGFGSWAVAETGIVSMLSFRLFLDQDEVLAGLNFYIQSPGRVR